MDLKREHIRAIIYYEWNDIKEAKQIYERIVSRLGDNIVSKSTVEYWVRQFRSGLESFKDDNHSGSPVRIKTEENIEIIDDLIKKDPKITFDTLAEMSGLTRGTIQRIIHEDLKLNKRFCTFVPHPLKKEQKAMRLEICHQNLNLWKNKGIQILEKIITGDETNVYYYDAPTRTESKVWVCEGETPPKIVKREKSIGKILYAIFFNTDGLVKAIKLEGQKNVTALWYTTECLPKVFESFPKGSRLLLHDNASSHTAKLTIEYLAANKIKTLPHPPYSPDLAMCDFWLFSGLKRDLRGLKFGSVQALNEAVMAYLESIEKSAWREAFHMWKRRMERCIKAKGDYFDNSEP